MANQHTSFTSAEIEKIRSEYPLRGRTIALGMNRSEYSIISKAQRLGVRYYTKADRIDIEKLKRLIYAGKQVNELAQHFNVNKSTIWHACKRNKVRIREIHKSLYMAEKSNSAKKNYLLRQITEFGLQDKYSKCCICNWTDCSIDLAHVHAAAKGGEYVITNIVPLCPNHHRVYDYGFMAEQDKIKISEFQKLIKKG